MVFAGAFLLRAVGRQLGLAQLHRAFSDDAPLFYLRGRSGFVGGVVVVVNLRGGLLGVAAVMGGGLQGAGGGFLLAGDAGRGVVGVLANGVGEGAGHVGGGIQGFLAHDA